MKKDTPSNVLLVLFELLLTVVLNTIRLFVTVVNAVYRTISPEQAPSCSPVDSKDRAALNGQKVD